VRVKLSRQAAEYVACLAPSPRQRLRKALKDLQRDQGDIQALHSPLQGYYRCRVGGYRIVFRYQAGGIIYVPLIERRPLVYQVMAEALKARLGDE
jgi:mRNA-degrading endonuclease RelE of RelBE toxin-antitoxin system